MTVMTIRYRVLCGSVYSFLLVRYSCLLSAGVPQALLCNWSQLVYTQPSGPSDEGSLGPKAPGRGTHAGAFSQSELQSPHLPLSRSGPGRVGNGRRPLPLLRPDSHTAEGSQRSQWVFSPKRTPPFRVCQGAHSPDTGVRRLQKVALAEIWKIRLPEIDHS